VKIGPHFAMGGQKPAGSQSEIGLSAGGSFPQFVHNLQIFDHILQRFSHILLKFSHIFSNNRPQFAKEPPQLPA